MGLIFKDADDKPIDPKAARLRTILFSLPFALMGIFALVLLLHDGLHRRPGPATCPGAFERGRRLRRHYRAHFWNQRKKAGDRNRRHKADDEKPWLKRREWAGGRIATSARKAILLLWIFVAFWCAASAVIFLAVVPQQLHQGNHAALVALIFPVIGLAHDFFRAENNARVAQIQPERF